MKFEIENGALIKIKGTDPVVIIPEGVERINLNAITGNKKFTDLYIPASMKSMDIRAFDKCVFNAVHVPSLETWLNLQYTNASAEAPDPHRVHPIGHLGMKGNYYYDLFINEKKAENLVLPSTVSSIGRVCFAFCGSLQRIEITGNPNIEEYAFHNCPNLKEVTLSEDIRSIGRESFSYCMSLERINLPSKLLSFGDCSFFACKQLKSITIPGTIKEIPFCLCNGCSSLEQVVLSEGITSISSGVFIACPKLTEIEIPSSVTKIHMDAFNNTPNLVKITIRCSMDAIGERKCFTNTFSDYGFGKEDPHKDVYIAADQLKQAKKAISNASFFSLEGKLLSADKAYKAKPAAAASKIPAAPGEIVVTYPADAPVMTGKIAPIVMSAGKPKSFAKPEIKELYVQDGTVKYTITLKVATKIPGIWRQFYLNKDSNRIFDPREAFKKSFYTSGYTDPKTGEYVQAPLQNNIPEGVDPLSADEIEARCVRFVTTVNQCVQENTIKKIMRKVQRKKNGTLYKGRLLRLAYLDLVDESGCSYELVAKNESDTQLCIELRSKVPVTRDFML